MTIFPCCKINLGLNVISRRPDGYHDIETVFYPIPLRDALDVTVMGDDYPSDVPCDLLTKTAGDAGQVTELLCPEQDNLVVKAYNILARDYRLPRVHAHLIKYIPSQAGMGGGSSDAAAMILVLNDMFGLGMSTAQMQQYAARLGADCAFFITGQPAYATGIGEVLTPLDGGLPQLKGYHLALVKPDVAVSTGKAYGMITPAKPDFCCRDVVTLPVTEWRGRLTNDFEGPVFEMHPELGAIKERLYQMGADFAMMSGSGSTLFGLFREEPVLPEDELQNCFTKVIKL